STNHTGVVSANETTQPNGAEISAFKETNKTETTGMGAMMHMHDYWGKDTRKVIWDQDAWLLPLPLLPDGKSPGTAIADFDIPYPNLTYEGTDHLELSLTNVTVDPTGMAAHPQPSLLFDYLTASDEPGKFRTGGEIKQGTPFILPVKPTDADMPHTEKSLWVFRLYTSQATSISFHIRVTAVKGNAIANWPPHPNLYADKTDRTVYDGDVKLSNEGTAQENVDGKDPAWTHPERVISWGTDSLDVTISNVVFTAQGGAVTPDHFLLEYHNATFVPKLGNGDQAGGRIEDKGTDGKTFHFHVAVDNQSYDSPYGQKSRWGFRLMPRFAGTADPTNCFEVIDQTDPATYHDLQNTFIGCQFVPWDMTYHLTVVAHGHSTANGVDAGGSTAVAQ